MEGTSGRMLSVVLSLRNEEAVLPHLYERLTRVLQPLNLDYELVFVDDASTDGSLSLIRAFAQKDPRVGFISMARRFGGPACIMAGIQHARGDAIIYMDTDLQDPPELLPAMIEKWREGAQIVSTVRAERSGESPGKMFLTRMAYRIVKFLCRDVDLIEDSGDFRLITREVAEQVLSSNEYEPYFRGLVRWYGFAESTLTYTRERRFKGDSHWPVFSNLLSDLALFRGPMGTLVGAISSFSILPLYLPVILALALGAGTALLALFYIVNPVQAHILAARTMPIAILLVMFTFAVCLAVLAVYQARIWRQVLGRPRYLVRESSVARSSTAGQR